MDFFLAFLLLSFGLGLLHKVKIAWRFWMIFFLAVGLAFVLIFFRQI